ncbi:hypothetical protein ACTMSW_06140 [Micromonospora sp. BQ11]|uniref:hypothetical protein n=1 Tax=Micromonospora sp. BQ11 TaxID=3452212 RepID=UPI003F8A9DCF
MAHGEAEHGCAQGESCRPGHHDQPAGAKHQRRLAGGHPADPAAGRLPERTDDDCCPVPRPRAGEPTVPVEPAFDAPPSCISELSGWAGAHRHGPVRPRHRAARRDRPPRRWC